MILAFILIALIKVQTETVLQKAFNGDEMEMTLHIYLAYNQIKVNNVIPEDRFVSYCKRKQLGIHMSQAVCKSAFEELDKDKDGVISLTEFKEYYVTIFRREIRLPTRRERFNEGLKKFFKITGNAVVQPPAAVIFAIGSVIAPFALAAMLFLFTLLMLAE